MTPFRVGMVAPQITDWIPLIPNTKEIVRELGVALYMRGFPLTNQTSWYKNASVIAKMIWESSDYVALDVYINHRPLRDGRYAAHVGVVRKGEIIRNDLTRPLR